ncbi:hypothetical protein K469DRAFT_774773 [Zopfia rhizophila CBS 207.26]|uniref:Uncharacterized protein n=1 Tax=Zopfia rhizophila CBS 207.26 TaxID=1314779 RepID=A0A6A6EVM6_9PEZI|nr:hypothetical protein K469DRAFT_774773 [Zopfia rhizophila CBS 207.26]
MPNYTQRSIHAMPSFTRATYAPSFPQLPPRLPNPPPGLFSRVLSSCYKYRNNSNPNGLPYSTQNIELQPPKRTQPDEEDLRPFSVISHNDRRKYKITVLKRPKTSRIETIERGMKWGLLGFALLAMLALLIFLGIKYKPRNPLH